jgi:SYP6 family syntaxin
MNSLFEQQNKELDDIAESVNRINHIAVTINGELKEQENIIEELNEESDKTNDKIKRNIKKTDELILNKDTTKYCLILLLLGILTTLIIISL